MLTYYVYFNLEEINKSIFGKFFKRYMIEEMVESA